MMPLPPLSSLQFAVIDAIGASERSGREVRERLAALGQKKSLPAFYQLMSRLEEAGFVKGWYEPIEVAGQQVKERRYKLTGSGIRAINETRAFYATTGVKGVARAAN
jgi:DNA-binding PadR family transcriptional regulator